MVIRSIGKLPISRLLESVSFCDRSLCSMCVFNLEKTMKPTEQGKIAEAVPQELIDEYGYDEAKIIHEINLPDAIKITSDELDGRAEEYLFRYYIQMCFDKVIEAATRAKELERVLGVAREAIVGMNEMLSIRRIRKVGYDQHEYHIHTEDWSEIDEALTEINRVMGE